MCTHVACEDKGQSWVLSSGAMSICFFYLDRVSNWHKVYQADQDGWPESLQDSTCLNLFGAETTSAGHCAGLSNVDLWDGTQILFSHLATYGVIRQTPVLVCKNSFKSYYNLNV